MNEMSEMKGKNTKKPSLKEMDEFFNTIQYNGEIRLSKAEVITDWRAFVVANLMLLKANSGNKRFMPYYNRLVKVYNYLKTVKNEK